MMNKQRWLVLYVVFIFLIISSPYWLWKMKPSTTLNVLIVNKTVPDDTYREHEGLVWLLNQQKYVKPNGARYELKKITLGLSQRQKRASMADIVTIVRCYLCGRHVRCI
ncbi:hypothetical protein JS44_03900 [Anoxybacillus flavithermus]|uniref:Uncharacterized protein n=1 Tax=Anoxybacillus flavithermus TaxID=33934 RepID=A0A094IZI2_9BACL|nr:hypothetical protein JS44_03900 [Anoxybacillus flavithermus]